MKQDLKVLGLVKR